LLAAFFSEPDFSGLLGLCGCVAVGRCVTQICAMSDLQQDVSKRPDDMIHVRVPSDLREVIARSALQEHRTLSGQVRFLIAYAIETRSQPQHGEATA
jgi:CopG-like RHH_1 or ribbon-helix-helix domain, RHH_5